MSDRQVVLLCGPPGAGKSSMARRSGLTVYDRDDAKWRSEREFRSAIAALRVEADARVVVIRSGASSSARGKAARLIGATQVFLLMVSRSELLDRIRVRGRDDANLGHVMVDGWFSRFDRRDKVLEFPGWVDSPEKMLGVTSYDW